MVILTIIISGRNCLEGKQNPPSPSLQGLALLWILVKGILWERHYPWEERNSVKGIDLADQQLSGQILRPAIMGFESLNRLWKRG
jgi:hypothetical protein